MPISKGSHLNRNTLRKVVLKREGYHHKNNSSCLVVREFRVLSLLSFRGSIFPPSSLDRSAGLAVVCVFFFFLGSDATMRFLDSHHVRVRLHVLREPADTLAVALAHDDGAHEDLHGADALESDLALASCSNKPSISKTFLIPSNFIQQNLLVWYSPNSCLSWSSLTALG